MSTTYLAHIPHLAAHSLPPPPQPSQPLIALQVPKPDAPESLGGWLRGIIDKPKYAVFEAKVVIEELANVPQMQGKFEAAWKFRGRAPHGKEASGLKPKPSLPNIKLSQTTPNDSTVSLQSRSSAESSLRSLPVPLSTSSPPASLPPSPRTAKKSSEPTPLRQSSKPGTAVEIPRSSSPEPISPAVHRKDSLDSTQTGSSDKSPGSSVVYFGAPKGPYGSVPTPRALPPTRSGTTPSACILLDPVPGRDDYPLIRPISRTPTSKSVEIPPVPSRSRILSGAHKKPPDPSGSSHRKGHTPARDLKQYTCDWSYTVHHTIKVPFGKSVSASGAATPNRREQAPILGGGATSDSGLHLQISEIPTQSTATAKDSQDKLGDKIPYGTVDIDLAAFAGRGKISRRFLLKGCKTNATVKVTVEMRQVAGDTHWAAPPLVEGHHVTGVLDLVDDPHHDLNLARASSGSSSGSSLSLNSVNRSAASLGPIPSRSNPSLVPRIDVTYDHHLKPSDAHRPPPLSRLNTSTVPEPPLTSATIRPDHVVSHKRSDHSLRPRAFPTHQPRHRRPPANKGYNEMSAEAVIEAIFNPRPSSEEGPMTYVPVTTDLELEPEAAVLEDLGEERLEVEEEGEKGVWKRMRKRAQTRAQK